MQASLRFLRIVHGVMLLSLLVYALLPEWVNPHLDHPPNPVVFYAITAMSAAIVAIVFFVRRKLIRASEELATDMTKPNIAADLRWRKGYILCFALCEAIGLYGLVLRFMGFNFRQVVYFYVVAIILMIYCRPTLPDSYNG